MTLALVIHPSIAHGIEVAVAVWLLACVAVGIVLGIAAVRVDLHQMTGEGRYRRRTPEPTTLRLIAGERPRFFDQDEVA